MGSEAKMWRAVANLANKWSGAEMGVYIYDVYQYKCISSEACGLKAVSLLLYLCVCVCVHAGWHCVEN